MYAHITAGTPRSRRFFLSPNPTWVTQRGPPGFRTCSCLCHGWRTQSSRDSTSVQATLLLVWDGDVPSSSEVAWGKCQPKKWPGEERQTLGLLTHPKTTRGDVQVHYGLLLGKRWNNTAFRVCVCVCVCVCTGTLSHVVQKPNTTLDELENSGLLRRRTQRS